KRWPELNRLFESKKMPDKYRAALTVEMINRVDNYMENLKNILGEATVTSSLGQQLVPKVLDVVRIFYPELIQHYICDVQPIEGMVGTVFMMKPRYEDATGVPGITPSTSEVFRNIPTHANYASEIFVVTLGTGNGTATTFTGTLPATPVRPTSFRVTAGSVSGTDNGSGAVTGTGISSGTVNYNTGAVSVTFASAPASGVAVTVEYRVNTEQNPVHIRTLKFEMVTKGVEAQLHPLKYEYSVPASMAAQSHLAVDVKDVLSELVSQYIKRERDFRIVKTIYNNATAVSDMNFDASMSGRYYDVRSRYSEIELKVDYAENYIQTTMGRGGIDFIICGANAANVFRNCITFVPAAVRAPIGAHLMGTLRDGTIAVIKVPNTDIIPANDYVVGFKGYMTGDSATIVAEWIPLYTSPEFVSPNLTNSQGMFSAYAIVPNNVSYYLRGTVSNYTAAG
ncbi:MAG: hypothetical protein NZ581_07910, partial [Candidatus Caldarchaeum sp.]|nr:hypothetical protein [Candidatus Caldarchaeum sp.]MDW8436098.1 hypothetical protein [Candidatus Caldarchaeum sp.]